MDDHTVAGRVAAILDVVAVLQGPTSLARLTVETGIPKPTVRRIANQLVTQRILRRDPQGYCLGLRLIELGTTATLQLGVAELASPFIHELHERTGQIAWVGTANADGVVILDKAFSRQHAQTVAAFPSQLPPETTAATAAGHLVLASQPAFLEQVLRAGGPARLTPYTVTNRGMLRDRLDRAADTGTAHESEETSLGWWCSATLVVTPTASYVLGLTGQTTGVPVAPRLTQLRRVADQFARQLNQAQISRESPVRS
jgi:DNA-binding IclR family transcriptional regulator